MMTREELEAALATFVEIAWRPTPIDPGAQYEAAVTVETAALKQLALMPEKCGECSGNGKVFARNPHAPTYVDGTHLDDCPTCHGSGKVYPPETVEKIWTAIDSVDPTYIDFERRRVIAVLDALGEA